VKVFDPISIDASHRRQMTSLACS